MLKDPRSLLKLAIIGALVMCVVGSFAYVAGWLSPGLLTPRRFVDGFEEVIAMLFIGIDMVASLSDYPRLVLRTTHSALAFLLLATFIAHFSGAMMHALIIRDGVFESMASLRKRPRHAQ